MVKGNYIDSRNLIGLLVRNEGISGSGQPSCRIGFFPLSGCTQPNGYRSRENRQYSLPGLRFTGWVWQKRQKNIRIESVDKKVIEMMHLDLELILDKERSEDRRVR